MARFGRVVVGVLGLALSACASQWKIHGGPQECIAMCSKWNLEFAGMVGVGNQDPTGEGATACVCQVPAQQKTSLLRTGEGASSAGMAAPITAAEAAVAAQMAARQQMQSVGALPK